MLSENAVMDLFRTKITMTDLQQHTEKRETRQTETLTSDAQFSVSTVDSTAWFTF